MTKAPSHLARGVGSVALSALVVLSLAVLATSGSTATQAQAGYRGFNFGAAPGAATRNKPEMKLWWNGGVWWGSLFSATANEFRIHRLDTDTQDWIDTGVALDNRPTCAADTLWTGEKLYVVSGSDSLPALLYRYNYDPFAQTYTRDPGLPVNVRSTGAEAITLARDTTGRLWITYEKSNKIQVACSNGSDTTWVKPFSLPGQGNLVNGDDISSVIAFGPGKIGVLWSNQNDRRFYFSVHNDGDPITTWQAAESPLPLAGMDPSLPWADDHINLATDSTGQVYAAIKTSLSDVSPRDPEAPLCMVLIRDPLGSWRALPLGRNRDSYTQPGVLIDESNAVLYAYATAPRTGGAIYCKATPLRNPDFPLGLGTPLIKSSLDPAINHASSTKQAVTRESGLVVLAGDDSTDTYLHAHLADLAPIRQTATFTPVADAYVDASLPASNYGAVKTVQVDASPLKESYLRFHPASVSGVVLSAKLRLYVKNASDRGGTIHRLGELTWTEGDVTWTNRPAADSVALATLGAVTAGQWLELDVTSAIVDGSPACLAMRSASKDGADYSSREAGAYAPQLVVEYAP